jgi:hypothetical protein
MSRIRHAAFAVLIPLALAGCAGVPQNRTLSPKLATAMQPVEVHIGVRQQELTADFDRSNLAAGAAVCGAIPGIGILIAAACGGAMGAMDASVNAERAKAADEMVRPLKDAIVDVRMNEVFKDTISASMGTRSQMKFTPPALVQSDDKGYEQTFRTSTSNAVMFMNMEYRMSSDFSQVEVSALGIVFARSPEARTAAGQSPQIPEQAQGRLPLADAAYRVGVMYRGALPVAGQAPADNILAWKAANARLLRAALEDGARQVARLVVEEMQRAPDAPRPVLARAQVAKGMEGDVIWQDGAAKLVLLPTGTLVYTTTVVPVAAQSGATASVAK